METKAKVNRTEKKVKVMSQYDDIKAPRRGLQEAAFRRYEEFIGQATKGSVVVNPVAMIPPCKAASFIVGIRDAMRGYRLFKYKSAKIPVEYEMRRIQVHETKDGKVLIQNQYEDEVKMEKARAEAKENENKSSCFVDENGDVTWKPGSRPFGRVVKLDYNNLEEVAKWCEDISKPNPLFSAHDNLLEVKVHDDEQEKAIKAIQDEYPLLWSEPLQPLQFRWWRIWKQ